MLIRSIPKRTSARKFQFSSLRSQYSTRHIVMLFQLVIAGVMGVILLQMVYYGYYSTSAIAIITILCYSFASGMLGFLALRFFSWFRSNKNRVVLFYAFASGTLTINAIFTLFFVTLSLEGRPVEVRPYSILSVVFSEDPLIFFLGLASTASFILSFILMWSATVLMMSHYAKRMGRIKYWIVVSIPLIYYSSQLLLPLINVYPTLLEFGTEII